MNLARFVAGGAKEIQGHPALRRRMPLFLFAEMQNAECRMQNE
jgi:hypothetical protein